MEQQFERYTYTQTGTQNRLTDNSTGVVMTWETGDFEGTQQIVGTMRLQGNTSETIMYYARICGEMTDFIVTQYRNTI